MNSRGSTPFFRSRSSSQWEKEWPDSKYALPPTCILLESVSDLMPTRDELHQALSVVPNGAAPIGDHVEIRFNRGLPSLARCLTWRVTRQRWTWRGRPIHVPKTKFDPFGMPPREVYDNGRDDLEPVRRWDNVASLGNAMIERPALQGVFNGTGSPLAIDPLEDITSAAYLG
jgi:hypothetical protein